MIYLKKTLILFVLALALSGCAASTFGSGNSLPSGTVAYTASTPGSANSLASGNVAYSSPPGSANSLASGAVVYTAPPIGNGDFPANGNFGPATSRPQVYITPNGDRVGHYPPYYYPDGPSGGSGDRR